MEDIFAIVAPTVLPYVNTYYISPDMQWGKRPFMFYIISLLIIGSISFYVNMKRRCMGLSYKRLAVKIFLYVILVMVLFIPYNYIGWPDVLPDTSQLFLTGLYLMFCSFMSLYTTKFATSNC